MTSETQAAKAHRAALPVALTIEEVRRESAETATLFCARPEVGEARARGLDLDGFEPGQFFMLWVPRLDEKPYTIAYLDESRIGMTVQERGGFSRRLCAMTPGERIGLRGPYGRGFWDLERWAGSERVALFGGGCGMATVALLAERLPKARLVQGSRSAELLLYTQRFPDQATFTDDGSAGRRGFPTEWLEEQAARGTVEMVFTCGPELMMAGLVDICRRAGIGCQVSMERYMKCGIGVCGQCECDGLLVCREGPVFDAAELAGMPSFGRTRRDRTGAVCALAPRDICPAGPTGPQNGGD